MAPRIPSHNLIISLGPRAVSSKELPGMERVGSERGGGPGGAGLQEASPLGSKRESRLPSCTPGFINTVKPSPAPSSTAASTLCSASFAHVVQLQLGNHRAQGVSRPPVGLGRCACAFRSPEASYGSRALPAPSRVSDHKNNMCCLLSAL